MSGSQHPLFSNAPITPAAPALPTVAPGSNLAAAMMQPHPFALATPSFGGQVPLSSMMQMMHQPGANPNPTPGNNVSSLTQQPDGSFAGTPGSAPQGLSWGQGAAPPTAPAQGLAPGMAGIGAPGTAMPGAPGMPNGPAPGTPSMGAVGTPSVGQPGQFGDLINRLAALYGGGGNGGTGGGYA